MVVRVSGSVGEQSPSALQVQRGGLIDGILAVSKQALWAVGEVVTWFRASVIVSGLPLASYAICVQVAFGIADAGHPVEGRLMCNRRRRGNGLLRYS